MYALLMYALTTLIPCATAGDSRCRLEMIAVPQPCQDTLSPTSPDAPDELDFTTADPEIPTRLDHDLPGRLVFFDFETTGLDHNKQMISLGWTTDAGYWETHRRCELLGPSGEVQGEGEIHVIPTRPINPFAAKVNGYKVTKTFLRRSFSREKQLLRNGVRETRAYKREELSTALMDFIEALALIEEDVVLVSYNGRSFDEPLLRHELQTAGLQLPRNVVGFYDVQMLARLLHKQKILYGDRQVKNPVSMDTLRTHLLRQELKQHDAVQDSRDTREVLRVFIEELGHRPSIDDFGSRFCDPPGPRNKIQKSSQLKRAPKPDCVYEDRATFDFKVKIDEARKRLEAKFSDIMKRLQIKLV